MYARLFDPVAPTCYGGGDVVPIFHALALRLMTRSLPAALLAMALLATPSCLFGEPKLDLRVVNESASEVQLLYEWGGDADERSVLTVQPNEDTRVEFDRPSPNWHLVVDGTGVTTSEDWPSDHRPDDSDRSERQRERNRHLNRSPDTGGVRVGPSLWRHKALFAPASGTMTTGKRHLELNRPEFRGGSRAWVGGRVPATS